MKSTSWSVGEVAVRFDVPTNVRRRYARADLVRVATIVRSKAAGMSLDQIAVLLDVEARGRHEVLLAHIADLDRRMEEMRISRAMTQHAYDCKAHDIASCPGFRKQVADLLGAF